MQKILLGLDVGERRIGVAASDALGVAVHPVGVIHRKEIHADCSAICAYIEERAAQAIVMGLPLRGEGVVGAQAHKVRSFAVELKKVMDEKNCGVPIIEWDESMSTHDAEDRLREMGLKSAQRKKVIDAMAAVVILESYLQSRGAHVGS